MERKMIFVKDWSTLLQYNDVTSLWKTLTNHVSRLWFGTNLFLSEYWVESSLSYKLRLFKKKQSSCFSFRLKENIFSKVFKLCKLIAIVTDKHQFAHAVYHPPAILLAIEVNPLTFTPLSRDTRLFTQGHTCVNRMQGHTCVNRKPDSNNKR